MWIPGAFIVFHTPGHIQLQLNSYVPKLISAGTLDKVSALLPGDLFLFPLPVCFLFLFEIDLVYPSSSCRTFSQLYLASSSLEWTYSAWKQCSSDSYYIFWPYSPQSLTLWDQQFGFPLIFAFPTGTQQSTSPLWILYGLGQETAICPLQGSSGWCMPCCAVPQADTGVKKAQNVDKGSTA